MPEHANGRQGAVADHLIAPDELLKIAMARQ